MALCEETAADNNMRVALLNDTSAEDFFEQLLTIGNKLQGQSSKVCGLKLLCATRYLIEEHNLCTKIHQQ